MYIYVCIFGDGGENYLKIPPGCCVGNTGDLGQDRRWGRVNTK